MSPIDDLLDRDADELEHLLLAHARKDEAPEEQRQLALVRVASASLGGGVVAGMVAQGARSSALKVTAALAGKWLLVGVTSGVLLMGAVQSAQQFVAAQQAPAAMPHNTPAHSLSSRRAPEPVAALPAAPTPEPTAPASAASAPIAAPPAPQKPAEPSQPLVAEPAASAPSAAFPGVPSAAPNGDLTRELSILDQARSALAQYAPNRALSALEAYQSHFPAGSLQAEAAALRVETEGQLGNYVLARQLGSAFLTSYPNSPLAPRVSQLTARYQAVLQKR